MVALKWLLVIAGIGLFGSAGALVAYRMLVLPEPAEFLSRQFGLWVGLAAAAAGIVAGIGQLATRGSFPGRHRHRQHGRSRS